MKPKDPMARAAAPVFSDPTEEEMMGHEHGSNGTVPNPPLIAPRGINTFLVPPDDDPSVLLGDRYLCRGDGMVIVSSSGMGKSALTIQAAVTWCFGLPFMGIRPNGCLRSRITQSEDSDGDIGEIWESVCFKMGLTAEQRAIASERVVIVSDRVNRGLLFIGELQRQVAAAPFDLEWINPLAAFITGDAGTQEAMADFLRAGLNKINTPPAFGYIVIQHTTKPSNEKNKKEPKWFEIMYDMAGSYDLIGWARSIISLRPTATTGEFNLVLAKRGFRAGVTKKVPQGIGYRLEAAVVIPVKHCTEKMTVEGRAKEIPVIFWEPREEVSSTAAVPTGRPKTNCIEDFISIFPSGATNAIGVNKLLAEALKLRHIAKGTLYAIINDGLEKNLIACNSANPKAPSYFVRQKASDQLLTD